MQQGRAFLWLIWAALAGTLALWPALPALIGHCADPWYAAQSAVAGFVLALLGLAAGLGSLALREALVLRDAREGRFDPDTKEGRRALRWRLATLWGLCVLIGSLGGIMIWHSDRVALGIPYLAGAAGLLALHAPWRRLLDRILGGAEGG